VSQHVIAAAAYAGMVLAAAGVALAGVGGGRRALRATRQALIGWVVAATLLAGLSQRNLWPLSSWSLMTGSPRRDMGVDPTYLRLLAVDSSGREYPVDYRAVEPFAIEELTAWLRVNMLDLPRAGQDSVAGYLLERLNVARARVRGGHRPGTQGGLVGPLRAPYHLLHPALWRRPDDVPATAFSGLRLYSETWDLEDRARDPSHFTRTLRYEYRSLTAP